MINNISGNSEYIEYLHSSNEIDDKIYEENVEQENHLSKVDVEKNDSEYIALEIELNGFTFPLTSALEVLLFVSDNAIEISYLSKALDLDSEVVYAAIQALQHRYSMQNSGLRIQEYNGRFRLVTHPKMASLIENYLSLDLTTKLSVPALETLAIIAYRQPVTRAQIEAIRGVDTSAMLRSLIQRGLIEEAGRLELVGRPILYSVTEEFLQHFGITGLDELPQLETTDADTLWATTKLVELQQSSANSAN